ncbi:MAG: hypothetical protein QOG91_393 [Candidatus Parcubacteria bacterium]|jgi:GMP synthase (glutamine-hydrolysing)|nr:hypothetical protein [Candidatus Parcubacteria bacterium]
MVKTLTSVTPEVLGEIQEEKKLRRTSEMFLLFSLGSQYDHLIAQMLSRLGVFCLVADPAGIKAADVTVLSPKGIILSGGPGSMVDEPPPFDRDIFDLEIPVLGICLGFQMWAKHVGADVRHAGKGEFNTHPLRDIDAVSGLLKDCKEGDLVLESHGDVIDPVLSIFKVASTENAEIASGEGGHLYGVQFHPEVSDTVCGERIFRNFCFGICGAVDTFPAASAAEEKIKMVSEQLTNKTVLLALSGGNDSSVTAYLLKEAAARVLVNVIGVYIRAVDRAGDEAHVRKYFGDQDWLTLKVVHAEKRFLKALCGKTRMRSKRLVVRRVYTTVLNEMIRLYKADFIAQGTLYTDISESGGGYLTGARKAKIKQHHNVGNKFIVPEITPLDDQVKDTSRSIGREIGVPEELLDQQPFPGPGLAVRISGEVTGRKLRMARLANDILDEELHKSEQYKGIWQAGAVVTTEKHTCTGGDDAGEGTVVAWWAVTSVNGFTARAADIPYDVHQRICRRFENEIPCVGAVVYRESGKPRATIEWG